LGFLVFNIPINISWKKNTKANNPQNTNFTDVGLKLRNEAKIIMKVIPRDGIITAIIM